MNFSRNENIQLEIIGGQNSYQTFKLDCNWAEEYEEIRVSCGSISNENKALPVTCFNTEGVDALGMPFEKLINHELNTLWFGVLIDDSLGDFKGEIILSLPDERVIVIHVVLKVVEEKQDTLSRLNWLNSQVGFSNQVTKGFKPVSILDDHIEISEHLVTLSQDGIIKSIRRTDQTNEFLVDDMKQFITIDEQVVSVQKPWYLLSTKETHCVYKRVTTRRHFTLEETIEVHFDGYMKYDTLVKVTSPTEVEVSLGIPMDSNVALYQMGLDFDGSKYQHRKFEFNKWHQNSIWIGSDCNGVGFKFIDKDYEVPFINVYYPNRPLKPSIWQSIDLTIDHEMVVKSKRFLVEDEHTWTVEMNLTPCKKIEWTDHFKNRYYQPKENTDLYTCIDTVKEEKCNILSVHHGQSVYPYINYPFNHKASIKNFVDTVHSKGLKCKLYYTLRELTDHIDELDAFLDLGHEIFPKNTYTGTTFWDERNKRLENNDGLDIGQHTFWVNRHISQDLIPAWEHHFLDGKICAAILTEPSSRLCNYYMAGLKWMMDTLDLDGIYIDDIALDRVQMKRIRHILDEKPNRLLDLHSWNHRHPYAGQISSMMLYLQHLPYFDSLWIGESYDYDKGPDYWLTEISGIPFGLTSQMLEGDGHPFRGMVYGMTQRSAWGKVSPKPMYQLWDDFGIDDSEVLGYWQEESLDFKENIKGTLYKKEDQCLLVVGSWSNEDAWIHIDVNHLLDFDVSSIELVAIDGLQDHQMITNQKIQIPKEKGCVLLLK